MNITNINNLGRFDKTQLIFPSVTRVLSILLTTIYLLTSASIQRAAVISITVIAISNLRQKTIGSWFESGCQLCAEVSSLP